MRFKKKHIILFGIAFIGGILTLSLFLICSHEQDPLMRIKEEINNQGDSIISPVSKVTVKASHAKMIDGKLILYSSNSALVEVNLWPSLGASGVLFCTAKQVSLEHAFNPKPCLQITFDDPVYMPRHMRGRSRYIPLEGVGWFRSKLYDSRVWFWYQANF